MKMKYVNIKNYIQTMNKNPKKRKNKKCHFKPKDNNDKNLLYEDLLIIYAINSSQNLYEDLTILF